MAETDSTSFWSNLDVGDVWGGVVDVAKASLPAALDKSGARGNVANASDKVAPLNTNGVPVSGAPVSGISKPLMIGGAIAALLLVVYLVRK